MRTRTAATLLCLLSPAAFADTPKCDTELLRLESANGRSFAVERYGRGSYYERTGQGRTLYHVHAWQGRVNGQIRVLTFTEIPGTSGPNWGSLSGPNELKAKVAWRNLDAATLENFIRIHGGPLKGEWKLACQGRPPVKVSFPRFADHPVKQKPYTGRIAKLKVPRGLHEEVRLRVSDALGSDDRPDVAGRYIRLKWPCGSACVGTALMDARTGRVIMLPSMSGWDDVPDEFEPIDGRIGSRLVVLSGQRDEKGIIGRHFYLMENGRLKFLRSVEVERDFPQKLE